MKHIAAIQTEFIKLSRQLRRWWDTLSPKQQRKYLYTHPASNLRMTLPANMNQQYKGFTTKTVGDRDYDRILRSPAKARAKGIEYDIIPMHPKEYIEAVSVGFGTEQKPTKSSGLTAPKNIKTYARLMREGTEFPMTVLDYANWPIGFGQEGRHRAYAAVQAGLDEIPVMVIRKTKAS